MRTSPGTRIVSTELCRLPDNARKFANHVVIPDRKEYSFKYQIFASYFHIIEKNIFKMPRLEQFPDLILFYSTNHAIPCIYSRAPAALGLMRERERERM